MMLHALISGYSISILSGKPLPNSTGTLARRTVTSPSRICRTSGEAPATPRLRPTSSRHARSLYSELIPTLCTVCPMAIRLTGLPTSADMISSTDLSSMAPITRFCRETNSSDQVRHHTALFEDPAARNSASSMSGMLSFSPRIHAHTHIFSLSRPNSACRRRRPPCTKHVSFTTITVWLRDSVCATVPPGAYKPILLSYMLCSYISRAGRRAGFAIMSQGTPSSTHPNASSSPSENCSDSRKAPSVTYRKSPAMLRTSWFPLRRCTAPPASFASFCSFCSSKRMPISSSPRSSTSPNWTRCVSPPVQCTSSGPCASSFITPAIFRLRIVWAKSP
mmetsp:Transcript_34738/g.75945  ORF Transcript_34738/g.75945 Transcript_34738/m.75945 type:complete len:335 (-) Transcript_34738:587-1591(-)